jgi:predicted RNase H-like nuclease (RuvC/YqgF family)
MAEMYAEYGVIGVVVILFSGMLYWFRGFVERLVNNKLEDLENEIQQNREITIKLIDRWNKETTKADRRHDSVIENAERRHEKLTFELRTQSESLNFLRGKLDKS